MAVPFPQASLCSCSQPDLTFLWVVHSRPAAELWGQRRLSSPHSLFPFKIKSFILIFLWCFLNARKLGVSPSAGRAVWMEVQPHICTRLVWGLMRGQWVPPTPPHWAPLLWSALRFRLHVRFRIGRKKIRVWGNVRKAIAFMHLGDPAEFAICSIVCCPLPLLFFVASGLGRLSVCVCGSLDLSKTLRE